MSETQPTNPEGVDRTETGEIKDQSPPTTPTITEPKAEPKKEEASPTEAKKEKPSLLNDKEGEHGGAPEKYEDFKVPEGFTLDGEVATEAGAIFKDLNLSQAAAQRLVDFYVGKTKEAADAPFKLWQDTQERWIGEAKADKEIGGKLPEVKQVVSRAIDSLGDPALAQSFREAMDITGAGNHPAFIKAFYKLAQKVTEGTHVAGGGPSPAGQKRPGSQPETAAKALYPTLP